VSLNVSAETEARIVAGAREAGVSVEDYLAYLVRENHAVGNVLAELTGNVKALDLEDAQSKIRRGVAQLERGEFVDGEEFMAELLTGIDDLERSRRTG
jgi:predicted transcriptional regulator